MTKTNYQITPAVDAAREFLEIASDFTNPLEVVREALSNSVDAKANEIKIDFFAEKHHGIFALNFIIEDDGLGMNEKELQSFFDLGNSTKRNDKTTIGEKGHGTKVYFNCSSILVETCKDGRLLKAEMLDPCASLNEGKLPLASVEAIQGSNSKSGTRIQVRGLNANQMEVFTHDRLKDYIRWFTKFGSCEQIFGMEDNSAKILKLRGLDRTGQEFEIIDFGHVFPKESKSINELFSEHVVRAPDFYAKKVVKRGTLRQHPFIEYEAIFFIEGNKVKHGYNNMIRRPGYQAPKGGYTVQERYGLWLCKDYIPIERKNEWISTKGSEFTKFHAFFNCQSFSLTANRGSVANTQPSILADIKEEIERIYQGVIESDFWRDMDWLEAEAASYTTLERERKDFAWRQTKSKRANIAMLDGHQLVEPTRESGVYALLIQLSVLRPDIFPFEIVDYDTHSGVDIVAKKRDKSNIVDAELYYVELKYYLEARMNHSFANMRYIVCWDSQVKHDGSVFDLANEERRLAVSPPDPKHGNYQGYHLHKNFTIPIEVFVLKDYLKDKLGLDFRPRTSTS